MITHMTSRDFNQATGRAKTAAEHGPVLVTDRGQPTHVLLTYEAYEQLRGTPHVLDRLAEPAGIEDVVFEATTSRNAAQPATFGVRCPRRFR